MIRGTIKIGGYLVRILEVSNLITDYEHLGEYSSVSQEIRLDSSLTKQQKKKF